MASMMFTPPPTGCSFVIDKKWYSPMVSHHNYRGGNGGINQGAVDAAINHAHGPNPRPDAAANTVVEAPNRIN